MISQGILLQAINRYFPDVWPCSIEDWKEFGHDNKVIKQKKEAEINRQFLAWVENLVSQEGMVDALRRLKLSLEENHERKEFNELTAHVLVACFGITQYASDLRSDQLKLRHEFREFVENLNAQFKSLKDFKKAYRRNKGNGFGSESLPVSSGFPEALEKAGLQMKGEASDFLLPLDFLETLIDEYLDRLELDGELNGWGEMIFIKNKIDVLIYPQEVPRQAMREDSIVNCLSFHLSFLFRQYTSPDTDGPWLKNIKGAMPSDGRPCYEQAVDIANTLFSLVGIFEDGVHELSLQKVRQRVHNLTSNGVQLGSLFTVDF
jgi:hypothetical protein